ncbi:site-specific integrase [Halonotius terrestris]|uniref:Site-specific integrase n=1 Tax=Halonotius terrestris TaxID=2487750 RepID=A0A8J8P6Q8_9EURY|nr:site-specific integrase [Halonotius terrestris]TQQ78575.1 site-specific integrase [Halonotius terrestris]
MRLKDYAERDGKRVWLSEKELQRLIDAAADDAEQRAAFLLMGRCGLRRQEVVDVTPADLVTTEHGRVVRVWEGKNDDYREVFAPAELTDVVLGMDRAPDAALVDVADSTLYDWVQRARERCHAATGDAGWLEVGPHDLRRSWGVRLLEAGVLPSVVLELGGWNDWQTFRDHYLAEFSPEALRRERGKVSWLGGTQEASASQHSYAAVGGRPHHE